MASNIIENCSIDETETVLSRYPHLKIICEKDRGQSDALNKGLKRATGDFIGWLNADAKYLDGCFDAVLEMFKEGLSCDICYEDYRFVDVKNGLIRITVLDIEKYIQIFYMGFLAS